MSVIENRIVEMDFDYAKFEDGIDESINSLEKFEDELEDFGEDLTKVDEDDTFGTIQDAIDDVSFDGIENGLGDLGSSFSAFETMATGALLSLGATLEQKVASFAYDATFGQVVAGMNKYEQATKNAVAISVQANETMEEVYQTLDKVAWYSDQTSYTYTGMTDAIMKFAAQNIAPEESVRTIMGIGNALSHAGLAAEASGHAFEIFSKAMSKGYMDRQQWNSLYAMQAVTYEQKQQYIETAEALGILKRVNEDTWKVAQTGLEVTMETFDATLGHQKGKWLTSDVIQALHGVKYGEYTAELYDFAEANGYLDLTLDEQMELFEAADGNIDEYGKSAMLAATQARTLSEAINAVKDASSSAWKDIFQNILGQADEATEFFTEVNGWLVDIFMPPLYLVRDITAHWKELGGRDAFIGVVRGLITGLQEVTQPLSDAWAAVFPAVKDVNWLAKPFISLQYVLSKFKMGDSLKAQLTEMLTTILNIVKPILDVMGGIIDFARRVIESFAPLATAVQEIIATVLAIWNAIFDINGITGDTADLAFAVSRVIIGLSGIISKISNAIITACKWIQDNVVPIISGIGGMLKGVIQPAINWITGKLSELDKWFGKITEKIDPLVNKLEPFLESAMTFIGSIADKLAEVAAPAIDTISSFFDGLVSSMKEVGGNLVSGLFAGFSLDAILEQAGTMFKSLIQTIEDILGIKSPSRVMMGIGGFMIAGLILGLAKENPELDKTITTIFDNFIETVKTGIPTLIEGFYTVVDTVTSQTGTILEAIGNGLSNVLAGISEFLKSGVMAQIFSSIFSVIGTVFSRGFGMVRMFLGTITAEMDSTLSFIGTFISTALNGIADAISSVSERLMSSIPHMVETFLTMITTVIQSITLAIPTLLDSLKGLFEAVSKWLAENGAGSLSEVISKVLDIVFDVFKIRLIANAGTALKQVGKLLKNFSLAFRDLQSDTFSEIVKSVSLSILAIAAAFFILSKINVDDLSGKIKLLAGLLLEIGAIAALVYRAGSLNAPTNGSNGMDARSLFDSWGAAKVINSFTFLLIAITASLAIIGKLSQKVDLAAAADILTGIIDSISGIVAVMLVLSSVVSAAKLGNAFVGIAPLIKTLGTTILLVAVSLVLIGKAAQMLEKTDTTNVENALWSLFGVISLFALINSIFSKSFEVTGIGDDLIKMAGSMVIISAAIIVFAIAAQMLQNTNPLMALGVLGAMVLAIAILSAVVVKQSAISMTGVALEIIALAGAVLLIALACKAFGDDVNWESLLAVGAILVGLVAILALIGWAAPVIEPGVLVLGSLATALLIFSAAVLASAIALNLFLFAIQTLSVLGTTIFAILEPILVGLLTFIDEMTPTLVGLIQKFFLIIWTAIEGLFDSFLTHMENLIIKNAPRIMEIMATIFGILVSAITLFSVDIIKAVYAIVMAILELFKQLGIAILEQAKNAFALLLTTIGDFFVELFEAEKRWLDTILSGLIYFLDRLASFISDELAPTLVRLIAALIALVVQVIVGSVDYIFKGLIDLINGVANAIRSNRADFRNACLNLIDALLNPFSNVDEDFKETGNNVVNGLIGGINELKDLAITAGATLFGWVKGAFNKVAGINSPSLAMWESGKFIDEGLALGIDDNSYLVSDSATTLGNDLLGGIGDIFADIPETDLTITPVLDLSNIENNVGDIGDILDGNHTVTANVAGYQNATPSITSFGNFDFASLFGSDSKSSDIFGTSYATETDIGQSLRDALDGCGLYMDGKKVGEIVAKYQSRNATAKGATPVGGLKVIAVPK